MSSSKMPSHAKSAKDKDKEKDRDGDGAGTGGASRRSRSPKITPAEKVKLAQAALKEAEQKQEQQNEAVPSPTSPVATTGDAADIDVDGDSGAAAAAAAAAGGPAQQPAAPPAASTAGLEVPPAPTAQDVGGYLLEIRDKLAAHDTQLKVLTESAAWTRTAVENIQSTLAAVQCRILMPRGVSREQTEQAYHRMCERFAWWTVRHEVYESAQGCTLLVSAESVGERVRIMNTAREITMKGAYLRSTRNAPGHMKDGDKPLRTCKDVLRDMGIDGFTVWWKDHAIVSAEGVPLILTEWRSPSMVAVQIAREVPDEAFVAKFQEAWFYEAGNKDMNDDVGYKKDAHRANHSTNLIGVDFEPITEQNQRSMTEAYQVLLAGGKGGKGGKGGQGKQEQPNGSASQALPPSQPPTPLANTSASTSTAGQPTAPTTTAPGTPQQPAPSQQSTQTAPAASQSQPLQPPPQPLQSPGNKGLLNSRAAVMQARAQSSSGNRFSPLEWQPTDGDYCVAEDHDDDYEEEEGMSAWQATQRARASLGPKGGMTWARGMGGMGGMGKSGMGGMGGMGGGGHGMGMGGMSGMGGQGAMGSMGSMDMLGPGYGMGMGMGGMGGQGGQNRGGKSGKSGQGRKGGKGKGKDKGKSKGGKQQQQQWLPGGGKAGGGGKQQAYSEGQQLPHYGKTRYYDIGW